MSCPASTFSSILDMKGNLAYSFLAVMDPDWIFLSEGSTMAGLKKLGTTPVESEELIICVIQGPVE